MTDRDPCPRCGVRGDVDCQHRRATAAPIVIPTLPEDGRKLSRDGGRFRQFGGGTGQIFYRKADQ